jgi:hypothetical protein
VCNTKRTGVSGAKKVYKQRIGTRRSGCKSHKQPEHEKKKKKRKTDPLPGWDGQQQQGSRGAAVASGVGEKKGESRAEEVVAVLRPSPRPTVLGWASFLGSIVSPALPTVPSSEPFPNLQTALPAEAGVEVFFVEGVEGKDGKVG